MKNLGKKGLTQSKAQSISNLCNQLALEIENKINGFNVLTKTLKYDKETLVMQEAKPVRDIENLLSEKAELHGLQAHLMEALKAKNNLMNSIKKEIRNSIAEKQSNSIKNFFEKFLAKIDQKLMEAKDLDRDQIAIDKANELILEIRELLSNNQINDAKKVYSELKVVLKDIGISVKIT